MPHEKKTAMIIRGVPTELRNHFKAFCAVRGRSMNAVIIEIMREVIKHEETTSDGYTSTITKVSNTIRRGRT